MSCEEIKNKVEFTSNSAILSIPGLALNLILAFCHYLVGNVLYGISSVVLSLLKRVLYKNIKDEDRKNIECFKMMSELCNELTMAADERRLLIKPKYKKRKFKNRGRQGRHSFPSNLQNNHFSQMLENSLDKHGRACMKKIDDSITNTILFSSSMKVASRPLRKDDVASQSEFSTRQIQIFSATENQNLSDFLVCSNITKEYDRSVDSCKLFNNIQSPVYFCYGDYKLEKLAESTSKPLIKQKKNFEDLLDFQKSIITNNNDSQPAITRDSGYHDMNDISNVSSSFLYSQDENMLYSLIPDAENYNKIKDIELGDKIKVAQIQTKCEIEDLKPHFPLSLHKIKISQKQVLDCPDVKRYKKLLCKTQQRINFVQKQIEVSHKRFHELNKTAKQNKEHNFRSIPPISLAGLEWQENQENRINAAEIGIIRSVKFAMRTRFQGMIGLKKQSAAFECSKNFCYDCATDRHKKYFIDGVDGCPIPDGPEILRDLDGFKQDCIVVRIINSWYADTVNRRYNSLQEKADNMEALFKRVRKETYIKRFYETGHLISQLYLTVSPFLHQFLVISPKSSVPVLSD